MRGCRHRPQSLVSRLRTVLRIYARRVSSPLSISKGLHPVRDDESQFSRESDA